MKQGKTLTELAAELERQNEVKRDYVAPVTKLCAVAELDGGERKTALQLQGVDAFPLNAHAHGQVAAYADIPKKYYDRMLNDAPELWAQSVNRWFDDHSDEQRMIRVMDDKVRAVLSDKFRPLENYDFAQAILPVIQQLGGLEVMSCEVTERRLFIKVVSSDVTADIRRAAIDAGYRPGIDHQFIDVASPSATFSNSEVGSGTMLIEHSAFIKACTNLTVFRGSGMRKYHAGARADMTEEVYAMLTDETRVKTDEAIWHQVRDITRSAFNPEAFNARVEKMQNATEDRIGGDIQEVTQRCCGKFKLNQDESANVLQHLIRGGDLSRYGLHNAITRTAQDLDSYERASELEVIGGDVIELPKNEWQRLAA